MSPGKVKNPPNVENIKPFRLVKYFAVTSFVVFFAFVIILVLLNTHWARNLQLKKYRAYARLLAQHLNNHIYFQFFIPVTLKQGQYGGEIQLRDPAQNALMDRVVRNAVSDSNIDRITIYDSQENVISYSCDKSLIGRKGLGGSGYQKALAGVTTSRLIRTGNRLQNAFGFSDEIKFVIHAPLFWQTATPGEHRSIIGVIEIVEDLSEEVKTLNRFQLAVMLTTAAVMIILFVVLLIIVRRGERIIHLRTLERIRLKEALARNQHLSSLGQMVASVSHEIRNPLGIINSSAALLKKKMVQVDPQNGIPDIIVEESSRLNDIITDFLNYARPKTPEFAVCQATDILKKNLVAFAAQADERQIVLQEELPQNLPEIRADSDMLYQAFLNLLLNAMQAMPEGGIIEVKAAARNGVVEISISDQGPGVNEMLLPKIWDPFFTTKERGTGLGLITVKNIIESHNGQINCYNRPAGGSVFIIRLPVQERK